MLRAASSPCPRGGEPIHLSNCTPTGPWRPASSPGGEVEVLGDAGPFPLKSGCRRGDHERRPAERHPEGDLGAISMQGGHDAPPNPAPITVWREDHASPWQRLGAFLLDCVLLGVPLFVAFLVGTDLDTPADGDLTIDVDFWVYPVLVTIGFLYQVPPVALWGKTLGKLIVGITVCSGRDLGRPGWWRALRRWGVGWWGSFPSSVACFPCWSRCRCSGRTAAKGSTTWWPTLWSCGTTSCPAIMTRSASRRARTDGCEGRSRARRAGTGRPHRRRAA